MKRNIARARVFDGRKIVWVKGTLQRLPAQKLKAGKKTLRKHLARFTNLIDEYEKRYEKVKLFRAGRKWWLCYSPTKCTGHFKSRKAAISWFVGGGR